MNPKLSEAMKVSLRRPTFVLVLLVLFLGAVGINAATSAMRLHFKKEAMPLRAPEGLAALPHEIGDWECVPEVRTVNPDLAHDLGTDQYAFRTYVDTKAVMAGSAAGTPIISREEVRKMADLNDRERFSKLMEIRSKNPNAVLSFAVTYYTGKVDTVPHVPDRCYVADGFEPSKYDVNRWELGSYATGAPRSVPVRFIDFEDQTARGQQNRCVTYFFHANGEYEDSPLVVRQKLQSLFERYGYFAKIEVMALLPPRQAGGVMADKAARHEQDREAAAATMRRFLTAALPPVERLLPDWNARPR
jgi:hypothetical protein